MEFFLTLGVAVGACLGLIHAGYVYRQVLGTQKTALPSRPMATHLRGIYYAVWTVGLWIIFGSYVFYLWILGVILYALTSGLRMLWPARQHTET